MYAYEQNEKGIDFFMEEKSINLLWMYPDMLNLHGDRGNILALGKIAEKMGITLNINKVERFNEKIDFESADLIFFNPGELKVALKVLDRLKDDIRELEKYIAANKYIIAIGTTGCIFGRDIERCGTLGQIKGLDFFDMHAKEREMVIGDDIYFSINDRQEIIGSQIHMLDFDVKESQALGEIKYGYGNNGTKSEGARINNLIFTNALGPVFVKNPWWAETLLNQIAKSKGIEPLDIPVENYEIEIKSFNSIKELIDKKISAESKKASK